MVLDDSLTPTSVLLQHDNIFLLALAYLLRYVFNLKLYQGTISCDCFVPGNRKYWNKMYSGDEYGRIRCTVEMSIKRNT